MGLFSSIGKAFSSFSSWLSPVSSFLGPIGTALSIYSTASSLFGSSKSQKAAPAAQLPTPKIPDPPAPAAPASARRTDTGANVVVGTSADIKNQRVSGRSNKGRKTTRGDVLGNLGAGGLKV